MTEEHIIKLQIEDELFDGSKDPFIVDEDDFSVAELIPRILQERKSFLSLTEEGLQREIQESSSPNSIEDDTEVPETTETIQEQDMEKIQTTKLNLTKNINLALNETSLTLDLVSLLISSSKPNLGKSTISPHLSKNVPLGSLNSDKLVPEDGASTTEANVDKIGQGWKYESLTKIKDLLKNKQTSLQEHINKETVYWNSINKVLQNNEILLKMRDPVDNSKSIGVKYGYGDSGSSFHDKGIAVLRRSIQTGDVSFNPISESNDTFVDKTYKYVKVKILSKIDGEYALTGQSQLELTTNATDNLITNIQKARFFIFEEDLFHQLLREARTLISYHVLIITDKIIIEFNDEIIEIESVIYDENSEDTDYQQINDLSTRDNNKCQLILNYFKIMLCGYFKYNLQLKQKVPTNFTKFKQKNSHPLILRPFIGHIKHELYINQLYGVIENVLETFGNKIEFNKEVNKYQNLKRLKALDSPFVKSTEKPISEFKLQVKNPEDGKCLQIDIDLTTSEIFVNLILELKIIQFENSDDLKANENGVNVLKLRFTDFTEIHQCVEWSIHNFLS